MPAELVGFITAEQYYYLMGMAGVAAGFVVLIIWARGL